MGDVVPLGIPVKTDVVGDVSQLADILMKQLAIMIKALEDKSLEIGRCIKFKCETVELIIGIDPIESNPHKPFGGYISPTLMNNVGIQFLELSKGASVPTISVMQQMLSVISEINHRLDVNWLVDLTTDQNLAGQWVSCAQHFRFNETHNIIYQIEKKE